MNSVVLQNYRNENPNAPRSTRWSAWLPLAILPILSLVLCETLTSWAFMWLLAFALFFGCKWLTWSQARRAGKFTWRDAAYLFAWVGLDAKAFLGGETTPPTRSETVWAAAKTVFGAALVWVVLPLIPNAPALARGWVGLVGLIFLLHFGSFHLLALFWQSLEINADPIMQAPIKSSSLGDFWGHRWNSAFNQLAHEVVFRPLFRRVGSACSTMAVFLVSGVLHDLLISMPARGGYGLPTAYFLLQGFGLLFERSRLGRGMGLRHGWPGRCFAIALTALPAFWLFHPVFVSRVIIPFLYAIHAN
jgi:hypothetical protein